MNKEVVSIYKKEPQGKLLSLEMMRAFCFLAVLVQHTLGAYIRRDGVTVSEGLGIGVLFALSKFAVPAFVSISGFVLFTRYYEKEDFSYIPFLRKRFLSLLAPYGLWSVVYYYQMPLVGGVRPFGKREFIKLFFLGDVNYHTWYIFLMVQFYLFLPLIFAGCRWAAKKLVTLWSQRSFVLLCIGFYCLIMAYGHILAPIPVIGAVFFTYRSKNFLFYLPYFLLGYFLSRKKWRNQLLEVKNNCILWGMWFFSYILILRDLFSNNIKDSLPQIQVMSSFTMPMFAYTCLSIVLLFAFCSRGSVACSEKSAGRIRFLGKHSYSAYLGHGFLLLFGSVYSLETIGANTSYALFYLYLFCITYIVSYLLAFLLDSFLNKIYRLYDNIFISKTEENRLSM